MKKSLFCLWALFLLCSCHKEELSRPEVPAFSRGADISWVTEMEARGQKFYNAEGIETDCFQLMKELGIDAVRLRIWVDPSAYGNWCNTADLVAKAQRAAALGMNVMVDFHYSDWWADPAQQHKPAAWKGLPLDALKQAIADHTTEVLTALKDAGVYPAWVQVGNEIRPGMLWDEDPALSGAAYDIRDCDIKNWPSQSTEVRFPKNWTNLAAFITVAYDAVKKIFPESEVIVHVDNGYDQELFSWFFGELQKNGGKWDMIGMSLYPYWSHAEGNASQLIARCIDNINALSRKYDCDVMIVETGMECADNKGQLASEELLEAGKANLSLMIQESLHKTHGKCRGVFYWEPQCPPGLYRLGAFTSDGRPTIIMDAFAH